jgi:hypothetical protein
MQEISKLPMLAMSLINVHNWFDELSLLVNIATYIYILLPLLLLQKCFYNKQALRSARLLLCHNNPNKAAV